MRIPLRSVASGDEKAEEVMAEKEHSPIEDAFLDLTASLFTQAYTCADHFEQKCGRSVTPEQFAQIVREFIFLFMHFIDRYSFDMYGEDRRCRILDSLASLLNDLLQEDWRKFSESRGGGGPGEPRH